MLVLLGWFSVPLQAEHLGPATPMTPTSGKM
jgi:hypothetical protein